jgi:hypothetical protein
MSSLMKGEASWLVTFGMNVCVASLLVCKVWSVVLAVALNCSISLELNRIVILSGKCVLSLPAATLLSADGRWSELL